MAKTHNFCSEYNYYEIIATLRKFLERTDSTNIRDAFLLRAELLSYIFSVDFLKDRYLTLVSESVSLLEEPNSMAIINRITKNVANKSLELRNSIENDSPKYLYYPSICDDKSKIIVQESLREFYCNNFSLSPFIFGFNLVHIEYYILSKPFLTSFFTSPNFDAAYFNTINLSVITSLIYYIEYQIASFYYDYNTKLTKNDLLTKINNDKNSERLKQIIKIIVLRPEIKLNDLVDAMKNLSDSTIKRALVKIAEYAHRKGELEAVKELIMIFDITVDDLNHFF